MEEKAADLGQFGLASPAVEITIGLKDGKSRKLLIGDDSPAGGGSFAKLDGDARVFTIAAYNKAGLDKTPRDLRDKRLLIFDPEKLTRVELSAKGQTVEFGKNSQNEWQIIKPQPLRADGGQVDDLVRTLEEARMELRPPRTTRRRRRGIRRRNPGRDGQGYGRLRHTAARGTAGQGQELLCADQRRRGRPQGRLASWATGSTRAWRISATRSCSISASAIRARSRSGTGPSRRPTRNCPTSGCPAPRRWMPPRVNNLIDKLRELAATRFVERGFTAPVFEATVTSNNGKRVEKVLISREGTSCFARRENEPVIYELDGKAVEELQKAASDVKLTSPRNRKRRRSRSLEASSLDGLRLAPEALQVVVQAGFFGEDVHDEVAVVRQDPLRVLVAFHAQRQLAEALQLHIDLIGDGLNLPRVRPRADDEVIGEGGQPRRSSTRMSEACLDSAARTAKAQDSVFKSICSPWSFALLSGQLLTRIVLQSKPGSALWRY